VGLRPLAAPIGAAAAMYWCIWLLRAWYSADLSPLWLLLAEILAGALSYVFVLRLVAPALVNDARTLMSELLRPKAGPGGPSPEASSQ